GGEHETALDEAGVGKFEAGEGEAEAALPEQVEVDGTGAPAHLAAPIAAEFPLDPQEFTQMTARAPASVDLQDRVEIVGLGRTDRRRLVDARRAEHPKAERLVDPPDGPFEHREAVAQVRAERDVGRDAAQPAHPRTSRMP